MNIYFIWKKMTNDELKELLCDMGLEGITVLENPSYSTAVIGLSHDDRLIYDYDKMVDFLVETDGMTPEEAMEFIDYNTIRALPYFPNAPIVLMPLPE